MDKNTWTTFGQYLTQIKNPINACDILMVTRSISSIVLTMHSSFHQHVNCHKKVWIVVKPIPLLTFTILRIVHIYLLSHYILTQLYLWIWFNSLVTFLWQMFTSKQYLITQVRKFTSSLGPLNKWSCQYICHCVCGKNSNLIFLWWDCGSQKFALSVVKDACSLGQSIDCLIELQKVVLYVSGDGFIGIVIK